jgi:hypothetical protein
MGDMILSLQIGASGGHLSSVPQVLYSTASGTYCHARSINRSCSSAAFATLSSGMRTSASKRSDQDMTRAYHTPMQLRLSATRLS